MRFLLSILFLFVLTVSEIYGQANVFGKMEVEIALPVAASETELLNFGKVLPETGGGTVRVSAQGERVATGNITLVDDVYSSGRFIVSGMPNSLVSVILPQTPQKMVLANSNSEITVDEFVSDIPLGGQLIRQADGKTEVSIGATLYLSNSLSNPAGYYSGTYEIIFLYN